MKYRWALSEIWFIVLCTVFRYAGKITRLEAEHCLDGLRDGTYLIRKCESRTDYTHAIAIKLVLYITHTVDTDHDC